MMQYLPSYKASHPEMNHSDAFGAVGAQWKGLSDEEKKPYQKIADDANAKAALNSGVDEVETACGLGAVWRRRHRKRVRLRVVRGS